MKVMSFEDYLVSQEFGADVLGEMIRRADYDLRITDAPDDLAKDIARLAYHSALVQSTAARIDQLTKVVAA